MDRQQAQQVFNEEILSRWPDFKLSKALMFDWINFLSNFTQEQVVKAVRQYVLNFDSFRNPALNKFREVINAQNPKTDTFAKPKEERWPQYFLQQDSKDCLYWGYGTFAQIHCMANDPSIALNNANVIKDKYTKLYGGKWNIIVCNDIDERTILIHDRATKNRAEDKPKEVKTIQLNEILKPVEEKLTDFWA